MVLQDDREVHASSDEEGEIVVARPKGPDLREAFRTLDDVSVIPIFEQRAALMKTVPRIFRGPLRKALKIGMEEVLSSNGTIERIKVVRDDPTDVVPSSSWW